MDGGWTGGFMRRSGKKFSRLICTNLCISVFYFLRLKICSLIIFFAVRLAHMGGMKKNRSIRPSGVRALYLFFYFPRP